MTEDFSLPELPIQSFDTATLHNAVGVIVSISILRDKRVQKFVRKTRQHHGIEPPEDRKQKDERLAEFPPEQFLSRTRDVMTAHLQRDLIGDIMRDFTSETPPLWIRLLKLFPFSLLRPYFMKLVAQFLCLDEIIETGAQMLARYIVTGLYEVPAPTAFPASAVRLVDVDEESGVIVAVILPFANLDAVQKQIRDLYTAAFVPGQRDGTGPRFLETAWLRFCEQQLKDDADFRRSPDQYLGAIAIEIDPEIAEPDALDVKSYDALVRARADTVRHNIDNFPHARQRFLTYRKTKRA